MRSASNKHSAYLGKSTRPIDEPRHCGCHMSILSALDVSVTPAGKPLPGSAPPAATAWSGAPQPPSPGGCTVHPHLDAAVAARLHHLDGPPTATEDDRRYERTEVAPIPHGVHTSRWTHPHEKIANPSPSPSPCAGLVFCPSPKPVGFSRPTGNPWENRHI